MTTQVLDHGYVVGIDKWGSDEDIIRAARMSTDGAFRGWGPIEDTSSGLLRYKPGDEKLLKYLWENNHHTPFEMCGATFEVQAPIMVFREWHRHRTFSYNEMSARYIPLPAVDYVPDHSRVMANSNGTNKQANRADGAPELQSYDAMWFQHLLQELQKQAQETYQWGLDNGIPKELARLALTVSRYSKMRVSGNLRNWLHFLNLREDESAQWEIRQYANVIHAHLKDCFPRTLTLFEQTRKVKT